MSTTMEELGLGGLFNSLAQAKIPKGRAYTMQNAYLDRGILEGRPGYAVFGLRSGYDSRDVSWGLGYGKYSQNAVQQLAFSATPTTGTWALQWTNPSGSLATSGLIKFNPTAQGTDTGDGSAGNPYQTIQGALESMSTINIGDVFCALGPLIPGQPVTVEFRGQYTGLSVNTLVVVTNTLASATTTVTPSAKVNGGSFEEFLTVIQKWNTGTGALDTTCTLYSIDATTGTYTSIATGLPTGDWQFAQVLGRIYAINKTAGLQYRTLGATFSYSASAPQAPSTPATVTASAIPQNQTNSYPDLSSATGGDFVGWGAGNPTVAGTTNGIVKLTLNTAITTPVKATLSVILPSNQNYQYADFWNITVAYAAADMTIDPQTVAVSLINAGATTITPPKNTVNKYDANTAAIYKQFQFMDTQRTDRITSKKISLAFDFQSATTAKVLTVYIRFYAGWPNDDTSLSLDNGPTKDTIRYAYSYRTSSGIESPLSPEVTSLTVPPSPVGSRQTISAKGSVQSAMSGGNVRFYRLEKSTGKWRCLQGATGGYDVANVAGGTVTRVDPWMEHELANFVEYPNSAFNVSNTGGYPTAIGVWKQCLAIGAQRQLWLSAQGRPDVFAPSPDNLAAPLPNEDDAGRPVTQYLSDNRAEDVQNIVGADSIYGITPKSGYALVGSSPADASIPRRLPNSHGSLGARAAALLSGGALVGSPDGLWFYSVSRFDSDTGFGNMVQRQETLEVRNSWATLLNSASGSGMIVFANQAKTGEIWAIYNARYLMQSQSGIWHEGTFADSMKAAYTDPALGMFLLDSTGRLLKVSTVYTTDAGTAINWSYESGWLDGPRSALKTVLARGAGTPTIQITVDDGLGGTTTVSQTKVSGSVPQLMQTAPAFRIKFRMNGVAGADTIESFIYTYEEAPSGRRN